MMVADPKLLAMERGARQIGRRISGDLPSSVGFCLLLFDFGPPGGNATYISNAQRADVIRILKEFLTRMKGERNGTKTHTS